MNEYIPDPIECAEAAAERAYDALSLPRGMMKCTACGKPFNPENEGGLVSMNPYAMPVCGECLEAEFDDFMKKTATPTGETLALPEKEVRRTSMHLKCILTDAERIK